jgi:hypothetical protein
MPASINRLYGQTVCGHVLIQDHILSSVTLLVSKTVTLGLQDCVFACMHSCAIATPGKGYIINSSVS